MNVETWLGLGAVFLGGAIPWLEAVVVIPAGIIAGLPIVPVVIAGAGGNLLTVALAAYAGRWLVEKWANWRSRRRRARDQTESEDSAAVRAEKSAKQQERIKKIMDRGGLPLLALVGPLGVGTQLSAFVAVAAGVRATPSFVWIGAATVGWCVVAAVATLAGFEVFGIGS